MDTGISLEYFNEHIKNMDFDEDKERVRALWTAYCFLNNIEVDTYRYDIDLADIYDNYNNSSNFSDYDTFDEYMCQLLI